LANIHVIATISGRIYGVAGYYSANDATQHVVVATDDGTLYEVHWDHHNQYTSPQAFAQFPDIHSHAGIHSLAGFFTPDDNFQHVVVRTEDTWVRERYFTDLYNVHSNDLLPIGSGAGPHIGMAGSYSSQDGLRHVAVGSGESILYEVVWNAQVVPEVRSLTTPTQFTLADVAAIAGFFDPSVHSQDVIVATKGNVYDVNYSGGFWAGGPTTAERVRDSSPSLVNVATFVSSYTHVRHIILLNDSGQLYDFSYTKNPAQVLGVTALIPPLDNVVDMAAYYSDYDRTNHVILVTVDGNVHEVYYT
jgi:hypothetical protein